MSRQWRLLSCGCPPPQLLQAGPLPQDLRLAPPDHGAPTGSALFDRERASHLCLQKQATEMGGNPTIPAATGLAAEIL